MKEGEEFTSDFFFLGSFVSVYTSFLKQTPAIRLPKDIVCY